MGKRNSQGSPTTPNRKPMWIAAFVTLLVTGGAFADWWTCVPEETQASYVGSQSCTQCHSHEAELWHGSHHDLAMDRATSETVLADFDDAELTHFDITSKMYRDGDRFMVHTEGPDGELGEFEVKYVLGVEPLQQYMVEFDRPQDAGEDQIGRLQVLRLSWDTEAKEWFYLPPPDVDEKLEPDDDLHWTGIAQRWNTMCADCHSTNLQKNYDPRAKQYHTTYSEIDVSCEACHGPGSLHVQLAESTSLFWDRKRGYGLAKLKGAEAEPQIQACAPCHARREVVAPGFQAGDDYYDYYTTSLLRELTYHADGQILDEDYVHGSFLQSKMYHKNIRCTDCHDPHTTKLKHDGNQLCVSCHAHSPGKYDTPAHHHHSPGSTGSSCVDCHMPATTYMEVDPRRDHSLRIPRPDLSEKIGTPNSCTGCHLDRAQIPAERRGELGEYANWLLAAAEGDGEVKQALAEVDRWAAERFRDWYGEKPDVDVHFATALDKARRGAPDAMPDLMRVAGDRRLPAIVRATSLEEMARYDSSPAALELTERMLKHTHPEVRVAALHNLSAVSDPEALSKLAGPLLQDKSRLVRTEAARMLSSLRRSHFRGREGRVLDEAVDELKDRLLHNADRGGAHLELGVLYENLNDFEAARRAYQTAIHVEPNLAGPRSNLAQLLEAMVQQMAQQLSRSGQPPSAAASEQIGRYQAEVAKLRKEELRLLRRDARLAPEIGAVQYRYGLSLYLNGELEEASVALKKACELEPAEPQFLLMYALLLQKQQQYNEAIEFTQELLRLRPQNESYESLLRDLRAEAGAAGGQGPAIP